MARCPLCEMDGCASESISAPRKIEDFTCANCGSFSLVSEGVRPSRECIEKVDRRRLSALCREQIISLGRPFLLYRGASVASDASKVAAEMRATPIRVDELLGRWPRSVPERIDRVLCNLGRLSKHIGYDLSESEVSNAVLFTEDDKERSGIRHLLVDQGLTLPTGRGVFGSLSSAGWRRFDELTRGRSARTNKAFVAMWFGDSDDGTKAAMDELYSAGIALAIRDAGYEPTRVDLEMHNDYIMNEVLALIRMAPFVVADFTKHRNGVYYEAGIARGLDTPMACCCRCDEFEKAHFDTKQLPHILWNRPEDVRKPLADWILAVVGPGPKFDGDGRTDR